MTGLEKMKNQILDEANSSAEDILKKAKTETERIQKEAQTEVDSLCESISLKSETDIAAYKERVKSSCDLLRRKKILEAKQEIIAEVLKKAYASILSMDTAQYFAMIKKVLEKSVLPQEGTIYFSAADLNRIPQGFESEIQEIAEAIGGKLTLAKGKREIESGFILVYGGIEENCTFKALFDAKKDELSDKVHEVLFL